MTDTLPEWLFQRFDRNAPVSSKNTQDAWNALSEDDQAFWQHEANAVRRATARNGFKRPDSKPKYVYVASSWRCDMQPFVIETLKAAGIEHYDFRNPEGGTGFAWSEIDPNWMNWTAKEYIAALEHPAAIRGFKSDFDAMQRADTFILVLPCGRSAHLELGWAVGAGKRTAIFTQDGEEPELMAKMVDLVTPSIMDLLAWLGVED